MKAELFKAVVICFFLSSFSVTLAQPAEFAKKGIIELNGSISYSSYTPVSNGNTDESISILSFGPQIGYFVADGFELSLGTGISLIPGISVFTPEEGDNTTFVQLFAAPSYNFATDGKKVFPFIEGQVGYTSSSQGNNSSSGISYGGKGGIKLAVQDHLLLTFAVQYLVITLNPENADKRNGINYLNIGIGVSGYL